MQQIKKETIIIKTGGNSIITAIIIMANFSPYTLFWIEFFPAKGIVTKHDQRLFGAVSCVRKSPKTYRRPVGTREAGLALIASLRNKKLDKHYTCRFFTDKQFGMAQESEGYAICYTRKQIAESFDI